MAMVAALLDRVCLLSVILAECQSPDLPALRAPAWGWTRFDQTPVRC